MFDQYVVNHAVFVIITCWSLPSDTDRAGKPFVIITGGGFASGIEASATSTREQMLSLVQALNNWWTRYGAGSCFAATASAKPVLHICYRGDYRGQPA